jgi:hypothetical protein
MERSTSIARASRVNRRQPAGFPPRRRAGRDRSGSARWSPNPIVLTNYFNVLATSRTTGPSSISEPGGEELPSNDQLATGDVTAAGTDVSSPHDR